MVVMFFFFKQKTAYEMRISDWSSDVCSSDLAPSTMAAATPYPADDDKAGWRDHVEAVNAQLIGAMQPMMAGLPVEISDDRVGGVPVFRARPTGGADEWRRVFLDLHGGALAYLGGTGCRIMAAFLSRRAVMPCVLGD